ncbi:Uncharacterised protein [Mycobacteroides abscessus subsp. abscessus]|nr:Uncharacterised protein [Mycobacteroides abscessus subsp. abscessus]
MTTWPLDLRASGSIEATMSATCACVYTMVSV